METTMYHIRPVRIRRFLPALLLASGLMAPGLSGCTELLFSARDLEVVPNPAEPGQQVSFVFAMTLVPSHPFTATAFIDGQPHLSESGEGVVESLIEMQIGDAADLIAQYGTGQHTARVLVQLDDDSQSAGTQEIVFELQEASP